LIAGRLFIAFDAVQFAADELLAAFPGHNPRTVLPRRLVADVPCMPAFQVRNPVSLFILMESNDGPIHVVIRSS
jgi:hypothetical protein